MAAIPREQCPHAQTVNADITPDTHECAECGAAAPTRVCLSCGHVGCCDSTRGHASAHAKQSAHPIFRSLPLSESSFTWCSECNAYLR